MKITIKEADLFTLKDGTEFQIKDDSNICKLEIRNGIHQVVIGSEILEVSDEFNYNDIEILNHAEFYHNLPGTIIDNADIALIKDGGMFEVINGSWTGTKGIEGNTHKIYHAKGEVTLDPTRALELNIQVIHDSKALKEKTRRLCLDMDSRFSGVAF